MKYRLLEPASGRRLSDGTKERVDDAGAAVTAVIEELRDVLRDAGDVAAIGHRVVHGGHRFTAPTVIDDDVLTAIDELDALAPLHNPAAASGIRAAGRALPAVPQVAVFDTAFHATLPPHAVDLRRPGRVAGTVRRPALRLPRHELRPCHQGGRAPARQGRRRGEPRRAPPRQRRQRLRRARTLIRPIKVLTTAAENMAGGSLEQNVSVNSQDELAQLATAFNTMSAKVAQANQLRRQMTADIAHDLRTPLTVIAGYIESMRDGILSPTPERLNLIYSEIDRLQDLVGDLRLLSRVDAGELPLHTQMLSPKYLLEKAAAPFQPGAEQQKVALRVEVADNLPQINVDEGRMMQVFSNLLSNALRYTPEGGEITLSAQAVTGGVAIAVRDTGTGIDAETLPRLFDRFYRVDDSRHSEHGELGLGLAIARALIEAHGGTIYAESTPGKGTTMHIRLSIQGPAPATDL